MITTLKTRFPYLVPVLCAGVLLFGMVAIPVAPPDSLNNVCLADGVDEVVCLLTPNNFYAVGQFYENFDQVEDDEVIRLLQEVWEPKQKSGHAKQLQNQ